jgi:hypothetical protein
MQGYCGEVQQILSFLTNLYDGKLFTGIIVGYV